MLTLISRRKTLRVMNWNVRNPSAERASKQAKWISTLDLNVLMLTELKIGRGANLLRDELQKLGFHVFFPPCEGPDYTVAVATRDLCASVGPLTVGFLPHRAIDVQCETFLGKLRIINLYVPSRSG